jgi:hypothetical protein
MLEEDGMSFKCCDQNERRKQLLSEYKMDHTKLETLTNYLDKEEVLALHWELYHNLPSRIKK